MKCAKTNWILIKLITSYFYMQRKLINLNFKEYLNLQIQSLENLRLYISGKIMIQGQILILTNELGSNLYTLIKEKENYPRGIRIARGLKQNDADLYRPESA